MKKIYLAVSLLFLGLQASFAQLTRQLDAFSGLEVTDKISVRFIPSTEDKIVIEGDLANQMEIVQQNDLLRLKMGGSYLLQGDKVQVTLYASNIQDITAKKGAKITVTTALKGNKVKLSAVEGAHIESNVQADRVIADAHTGAVLDLNGSCKELEIASNLGGEFRGKGLISESAIVRINGGGKATLYAKNSVEVQTRAGGVVDVYGKPALKKERKFAGGKINYL